MEAFLWDIPDLMASSVSESCFLEYCFRGVILAKKKNENYFLKENEESRSSIRDKELKVLFEHASNLSTRFLIQRSL